jgi:glyoxylase-like metal-dependent hydrolase (beta-lactamase superfamily II)
MRRPTTLLIALAIGMAAVHAAASDPLGEKVWIHGSQDCRSNRDPAIEVFQVDAATYILRQNKCVHFEAPFIYVLFGEHTVFVQDTGATADAARFPLYEVLQRLIAERGRVGSIEHLRVLVTHSHSHGDHTAADPQLRGRPGVTLIEPDAEAIRGYFGFTDWPNGTATIDLGARVLVVLPAPGHQDESIAVFDPLTGWLLTADTLYPGRLYVKDWDAYRSSIQRLAEFSRTHPVSAVMGTHIEISRTGKLFPAGSTYQPDEAGLPLSVQELLRVDESLRQAGSKPTEITTAKFVVTPLGALQRVLGSILKAIGVR